MANQKITDYTALTGAGVDPLADLLEIVDFNVLTNKKILVSELAIAMQGSTTVVGTGQFATAAQTLTGTDATKLLTPNGFAGNKSLVASGFYKFPGGLIVQWGTCTTDASGGGTITWPTAFSSSAFIVVILDITGASRIWQAANLTTTGCNTNCQSSGVGLSSTGNYIVIGN